MRHVPKDVIEQHISSYFHAEKKGSELIASLLSFAPEDTKAWIRIWTKEEAHHHVLWSSVVRSRKITPRKMDRNVQRLFDITESYVNSKNWAGSMVGAAVIEHLSNAAANYLYHDADDDTKRVFRKIVGDDLGHLDFDIHQIEKIARTPEGRREIMEVHKKFLMEIIEWPLRPETSDCDMDILNDTYRIHREAMRKIGIKLPRMHFSRGASFRMKRHIIKMLVGKN